MNNEQTTLSEFQMGKIVTLLKDALEEENGNQHIMNALNLIYGVLSPSYKGETRLAPPAPTADQQEDA